MPTYEYECQKCPYKFDLSQPMSAAPIKICPKCKGKIKRLIGKGSGIIFKGSGFYATDYRKPDKSKGEKQHVPPEKEAPKEKPSVKKDNNK